MAQSNTTSAPAMVAVGSPEFDAAVAAAVARTASPAGTGIPDVVEQKPVTIQATSIDLRQPGLDDLTVRFARFCTFQNAGYQRGQDAGFPRKAAEELHRSGAAFIVHDPRRSARAA